METLNKNGVSITQTPGEEKYVKCCLGAFRGQIYFQYDYRHTKQVNGGDKQPENEPDNKKAYD